MILALLAKARDGNERARMELMERLQARVLAAVRGRLGTRLRNKLESQDIVQSVFVDVLDSEDPPPLEDEAALIGWLAKRVENKIRDLARYFGSQKRDHRREVPLPASEAELPPRESTPSLRFQQGENQARIQQAMEKLTERERQIVRWKDFMNLTFGEIGHRLGTTREGARWAYSRAVGRLMTIMISIRDGPARKV
jgi:RNA polymerase sigma-70 factor (ECF subfamily)